MAITEVNSVKKEIKWASALVKKLRGKRTQAEFGELLGVPKNTVWRWEAGYARPAARHSRRLSALAAHERFLENWKASGSLQFVGDIEEGSRMINEMFRKTIIRSARQLME